MSSERDAFLAAIAAADEDDFAPHLVFADWLEEQGDPQAEFIRLQCADRLSVADELRRNWLETAHAAEWLRPLRRQLDDVDRACRQFGFVRGFPTAGKFGIEAFLGVRDSLPRVWPGLQRVALDAEDGWSPTAVSRLTADRRTCLWPELEIRYLDLDSETRQIVEWIGFHPVRRLHLQACAAGAESLNALVRQPWGRTVRDLALTEIEMESLFLDLGLLLEGTFPALRALDLSANQVPELVVSELLRSRWCPELKSLRMGLARIPQGDQAANTTEGGWETLSLTGCDLSGPARTRLFPECPRLGDLELAHTGLTESGLDLLDRLCPGSSLRRLNLAGNQLGDEGLIRLARSRHVAGLESMNISVCGIEGPGLEALATAECCGLTDLRIEGDAVAERAFQAFLESHHRATLRTLHLGGAWSPAQWSIARVLIRSLPGSHLQDLSIVHARLDLHERSPLWESGTFQGLRSLRLGRGGLDGFAAENLARSAALANLQSLDLAWNDIRNFGAAALAASPYLLSIRRLTLDHNRIGPTGVRALATSPALSRLTHLDLLDTDMDRATAELLAEPDVFPDLLQLKVSHRIVLDAGIVALRRRFGSKLLVW